jgi:hypothetical protein
MLTTGLPPLLLVAANALLLFLPGYAAATLLLPAPSYRATERLLVAPALTLATLALVTLWASTLRVPLGHGAAVALLAACPALLVGLIAVTRLSRRQPGAWGLAPNWQARWWEHSLRVEIPFVAAYLALFALALGLRLWSTRGVLPTLGADTYHHTLIAQLVVARGGLPDSYAPYAPIQSFAYHFGFHSLVAWLHWWTGADVGALVGLAGHLVNAAVALSVAFFVLRVVGDGLVAALAAWLVALLCVFPAYLVNWGRYTQTAGLLLLPVAAALCIDALSPARDRGAFARSTLAAGLAASGLLLAHYRMAAMLALLLAIWLLYVTWMVWRGEVHTARKPVAAVATIPAAGVWRGSPRTLQHGIARAPLPMPYVRRGTRGIVACRTDALARWAGILTALGAVTLAAGLLVLPWLVRLSGALSLGLGQQPGDYGADYFGLERLGTAIAQPTNIPFLALAALGLLNAWLLRQPPALRKPTDSFTPLGPVAVLALGAWALAQLALANPRWWPIPMPLAGRVDLVTTIAALCFPLAVAAALALAIAWRVASARWRRRALAAAVALGVAASALGGWQLQALVTPNNALVTPADLAAAAWLRAHTPADARVAVSTVIFPWAPDYVVGVDAGYWLPLLAGRATTALPMLYPGERGADSRAVAQMVAVAEALRDAPAALQTAVLLRSIGVGYVYHSGRSPVPSLTALAGNPALRLVYDQDGVRIWTVAPE